MKKVWVLFFLCFTHIFGNAQTTTFNYTGGVQTYTVPAGVTSVTIDIQGAMGGGTNCTYGGGTYQSLGGCGGRVQATLVVTPGQVLNVIVGGEGVGTGAGTGGYGGGGTDQTWRALWPGAGGGGGTTIIDNATGTTLAVAGGGGGGGGDFCAGAGIGSGTGDVGGAGGGLTGAPGNSNACAPPAGLGGQGGTPAVGGAGSACAGAPGGNNGALGIGGDSPAGNLGSGGGGGGYYGGGAGDEGGGGGGGSSYTDATYASAVTHTQGYNCANGVAFITVACTGPAVITGTATSVCVGATIALSDATAGGTWSTASTTTATVSATGVVTGVAEGISTITYTIPPLGCYMIYTDTVEAVPSAISGPTSVCTGSSINLSEASVYGTWSSSNSTVATVGIATGIVTGSIAGTAVVTFANACGTAVTTITVNPTPGAITGATAVCPGSTISLSDASAGGTWSSATTTVATVDAGTGIVTAVIAGTSVITYMTTGSCTATIAITVDPGPPAFTITPPSATFCTGYQMLTAPVYSNTVTSTFVNTTVFTIPNNTPAGITSTIAVAGISATSTIIAAEVELNDVTMNADDQLTFNIQAPNGNNLNLVNREGGGSNRNFTNTIIPSVGGIAFTAGTPPFTGTFAADAAAGIGPTLYPSNVTTWPALYSIPNGNWLLCARDWVAPTKGKVHEWSLRIRYTVPTVYTWMPAAGLYTNSGLTVAYIAGTATNTVYASPVSTTIYTATATIPGFTCSTSSTATITIGGGGTITGPTAICSGVPATLSVATTGGTWSSSNSAVATVTPGPIGGGIVTGVTTGTVVVTYNNGCTYTTTITVTAPPGTISGTKNICSGGITTTLSDAAGGTWTSSNSAIASVGSLTGIVTSGVTGTSGTTTITYSNGCGTSATTTFSVTSAPVAITGGPATICSAGGSTVTLSDATAGGTWSSGTTAVASVGSLTGLVTGGVLIAGATSTAVITYSNGCGTAPTTVVTVNAPPGAITGNTGICAGATTTLGDASNGTWSSGTISVASIGSLTGVVTGGTVTTVSNTTMTYSNGCLPNAVTTVTVTPIPLVITGTTSVCTGSAITLSDATAGGTWSSSNTLVATVGSATGVVTGGGITGTSTITYSNGCGSPVYTMTVSTAPTTISGATIVCLSGTTTLSNNGAPTGTWTSSNPSIATVNPVTGAVTSSGTGAGTTTITASNLCGNTTILFTVSNPTPIAGVLTFCQDATTTLSNGVGGGVWSSGDIAVATTTGLINDGTIYGTGPGLSAGTAPITYTLSTGCIVTTTVTTTPAPAAITGFFSMCAGSGTCLTDATAGGVWSIGNTSIATIAATGCVEGILAGMTSINYTIGTCFATATITVNASPAAITGLASVCVLSTITLSDATTFPPGNWSSSNSAVATIDPGSGVLTGVSSGTVTVTYTLGTGCITTTTITVNPLPVAITGNMDICYGQTSQLSDATPLGTWSSSAATVANVTTGPGAGGGLVTPTLPAGGVTTITYTLPTSCSTTATFTVNPLPSAIIGLTGICTGTTTALTDGSSGGTWTSATTTVATIGLNSGVVTAGVPGTSVITYTLSTGCTATITITVNQTPVPITGNTIICAGLTTNLSDATGGGLWSASNTNATIVSTTGLVTGGGVLVTSYDTVTYTRAGCSATTTVTVNPLPGAIIGTTAVCSGLTIALTDLTSGGTWSSSNSTAASIDVNTGLLTGGVVLTPTIVTITYTLATGCTKTVNVTVNPLPTTITGNTTICAGLTTQLSDGSGGGTWSSNTTSITIGLTSGFVMGSGVAAQSTATVTYTLGTGCLITTTVTVNPLPAAVTGNTTICVGLTTTLSDATVGGTWSSSVIATATIGSTTGLVTGGNVLVSSHSGITYTLGTGCIAVTTVTVNPLPTVITGNTTICAGLTTQLSNGTAGGVWSSNTTSITIGSSSGLVTGSGVGTQSTATVTYTLGSGCIMTTTVTVNPLPGPITGNTTICAGLTTTLSDATPGGTWSSAATTIATIVPSSGFVTGGAVMTQQHTTITYSLTTGCIITTTVTVNPLPLPITGANALCQGTTINLSDPTVGGVWSSSNTILATIIPAAGTGVLYADTAGGIVGIDTITYTLGTGCIETKTVTVNLQPYPITGGPLSICNHSSEMLSDATAGGVWSSGSTAIATVLSGNVTGAGVGNTNITYSIGSCSSETGVFVNTQPVAITGTGSMCSGAFTTLSDATPGGLWTSSNTMVATVVPSIGGVTVTGGSVTVQSTAVITYTIGSCTAMTTVTVNVQPGPVTGITSLCNLSTTTLSDATAGGIWSSVTTTIATVGPSTGIVTGTGVGSTLISYTEVIGGCSSARSVTINIQPGPISGIMSVCNGLTTQLSDIAGGGVWSVDPSTISIAAISSTGLVTGLSAGTAIITHTIGSCFATATVTVNPLPSPISGIFYVCLNSTTTLGDLSLSGAWSSSVTTIASAGMTTGIITGNGLGTAMITYTLPTGCITTHTVTVIAIPSAISGSSSVCAGQTVSLSDSTSGGTWTSGNVSVATIGGGSGVVTGVSSGTVVISYTLGTGCRVVAPVVVNPLSPVTGTTAVCIGQATNLSDTTVGGTWSSSSTAIATVNQVTGVVTGTAAGVVTISYNLPTGCTATALVTVNALPLPITGITGVCQGQTTTLSDGTPGGVWSSGNVTIATVDATGDVTGNNAGVATITYTSGCFITATVTVNPLIGPILGTSTLCLGQAAILSNATSGGTWSSTVTTVATITPGTGFVTSITPGTTTIIYTPSTGCAVTMLLTVYPLPPAITGITTVCVGSTTTLSDSTIGGAWFSGNPSVATVSFVGGVVTGVSAGTALITYVVATGCTQTVLVTVNPVPTSISPSPAAVCVGSTLALFSGTGGTWTSSATLIATIDSMSGVVTGDNAGTSVISYTIGTGCAAMETLTVNPLPDPVTGITTVCYGMTTNLSDATPGGVWSSLNPSIGTVDAFGVVYDVAPAGSFIIVYTLPTGCTQSVVITINPPPVAISGPAQVCVGSQITLNDGVSGGMWTSSNTSVATIGSVNGIVTGVAAGATIITYTMGGGSCYVTYVVTVNPLPAAITGIMSVCVGLTTQLSDGTTGGTWSSITTTVATIDPLTGILTGVGTTPGLSTGESIVSYTLPTGCASTATVTVNPLPAPISGNTNVCLGDTRTLSDSPTPGTWSSSNSGVTTVVATTGVVYGNNIGVDTVTYTISATGCIMTTTVAVHPLPAIYAVTGGGSYCGGTGGVTIGLSGSDIGVEYLLYLGPTVVGTFAGTGSSLSFGLQTLGGTYTVVALNTFTTCSNNMSGSATVTIIPSPLPSVSISSVPGDTVCAGTPVTYTATPVNGGVPPGYVWSVNGVSVGTGSTYSYTPANGDAVVVTLTSSLLCASPVSVSDTVVMTVRLQETPSVGLLVSPADTVCMGTAVTLTAVPSYGGYSPIYLWNVNGTGVAGITGAVYTYMPSDGDIVYCRMVSDYECRLTDTVSSAHEVITVDTPEVPVVSIVANPGWTIGQGASDTLHAVVTNGGGSPSYQWYVNGVPVPGATSSAFVDNNFSYPNEDSVGCQVTGSGYCQEHGFAWLYVVVNAAGVVQVTNATADLSVVPNPNNGAFTLKGTLGTTDDEEVSLELTDVLGQVVYKESVQTHGGKITKQVNVAGTLANGMYMFSVRSASVNRVFHVVIEQ